MIRYDPQRQAMINRCQPGDSSLWGRLSIRFGKLWNEFSWSSGRSAILARLFSLLWFLSQVPPHGTTAVPLDLRGGFVARPTMWKGTAPVSMTQHLRKCCQLLLKLLRCNGCNEDMGTWGHWHCTFSETCAGLQWSREFLFEWLGSMQQAMTVTQSSHVRCRQML